MYGMYSHIHVPTGKKARDFMDRGVLVPDEVVVEMVKSRLASPDVQQQGWLLDGYPRSASQAEAIEREGIRPDIFLLVDVSVSGGVLHDILILFWQCMQP